MKNFIIFLILNSFLFSNEINLPDDFLKKFKIFKTSMIKKDAKKLYDLQLPYFKYLYPYNTYKAYIDRHFAIEDIKIQQVISKNDEKIQIFLEIKQKNKKNMIYYDQTWYKMPKGYFMLTKDMFMFRD